MYYQNKHTRGYKNCISKRLEWVYIYELYNKLCRRNETYSFSNWIMILGIIDPILVIAVLWIVAPVPGMKEGVAAEGELFLHV
ncbi:143_t:CDS:2 [Funneliformis geosporum]|nr:143_t:CDS:2 [Funneliformis geosporum]